MEDKDREMLEMKDVKEFFTLIEKKMEKEGFKVIETLPPAPSGLRMVLPGEKRS